MAVGDFDELCRLLLGSPVGMGSSTRHGEAVSLLRGLDDLGSRDLVLPAHGWGKLILCRSNNGLAG